MGATEAEIEETVQLAASVGAGVVLAMADRARQAADEHHYYWRPPASRRSPEPKVAQAGDGEGDRGND
ncbi:MAG: hypothetical protein K6U14_11965 [Firmicutes bacterium]|nr:hypothetical protein [Alicyclobacillaceae bacterium]MCL6498328.1 hypothetical protein [Bacillota bacterium]